MRSNQHLKAVELYTCAIALNKKNAIYYCNRYGLTGEIMAANSRVAKITMIVFFLLVIMC
jgi:hypothetical protein